MSLRNVERDLVHAQLRLMSTDPQALEDAERYVIRALFHLFELRGKDPAQAVLVRLPSLDGKVG